jgi:hypothetical protein
MKFLCHKIALVFLILGLSVPFAIFNDSNIIIIDKSNILCLNNGIIDGFNNQVMFPITTCENNMECLKNLCQDNSGGIFIEKWISTGKQYDFVALPHQYYYIITFIIVCIFLIVIFNLVILYKIYDKSLVYRKTIAVAVSIICLFTAISSIFYCINIHSKTINNLDCLGNISITGYGYLDYGLEPITKTKYCSDIGCFMGNTSLCKNQYDMSVVATNITYGSKSANPIDLIPISPFTIDLFFFLCVIVCVPLCFAILICDCNKGLLEINGLDCAV